ncbi:MAG: VOC family protein [Clostridia bacterium]|nr:VOC family protein [Clostridia bacterium]
MYRSMMQTYVIGSDKAVELYQRAFEAKIVSSYPNPDGTFYHAELDIYGQILAVAEARYADYGKNDDRITGNTMQFCLHFGQGKEDIVQKAFDVLKDGANILYPLSPCEFSPLMTDFIDRFGIRWCLFV